MLISERIFKRLEHIKMSQKHFAAKVGIACSTVSEWKKKKTNPSADKIMDICNVLEISPEQLLTGDGIDSDVNMYSARIADDEALDKKLSPIVIKLIDDYHSLRDEHKKKLIEYVEALKSIERLEEGV